MSAQDVSPAVPGSAATSTLTCIDLDRTVIYSPRALLLPGTDHEAPRLIVVEVYQGEPLSFVTEQSARLLPALAAATHLVPTTTRTPLQLARVDLPGVGRQQPGTARTARPPSSGPSFAIASNGGHLLVDGVPDEDWNLQVRRALSGCAPVQQVHAHLQEQRGEFVDNLRTASDLFVYCVVDRAALPAGWVVELSGWCAERGWGVSVQGRKIYCVPGPLTKSAAAREVQNRTGAGRLVAAGDSLLDAELLQAADAAVRPAQGELADTGWTTPGLHITTAAGVLGGEELVRWLLAEVRGHRRASSPVGSPRCACEASSTIYPLHAKDDPCSCGPSASP